MATLTCKIKHFLGREWIVGLFLLGVFLLTNGYTYGWDDQHLEIPLLKSLIDPGLYAGDYYVESLKQNFTSFLYPLIASVITVNQIEPAYLVLYLLSRYFLFFFMFKIWHVISGKKLTAIFCVVTVIAVGRVEEFLYRTFSHQEFALAIIFAGIYFFYKDRFILASAVLGIAANFHALYSLFPFSYMCLYLLWQHKRHKISTLFKACATFFISMLPVLVWIILRLSARSQGSGEADASLYENWMAIYKVACPQNFIFHEHSLGEVTASLQNFFNVTRYYWVLVAFLTLNLIHNDTFRRDKKVLSVVIAGVAMLVISFLFNYVWPNRFVIDLNLIRNTQYMLFFLMGYTVVLYVDKIREAPWTLAFLIALLYPPIRISNYIKTLSAVLATCFLSLSAVWRKKKNIRNFLFVWLLGSLIILSLFGIYRIAADYRFSSSVKNSLFIAYGLMLGVFVLHFFLKNDSIRRKLRYMLIIIPLATFTGHYTYYHMSHLRVAKTASGFWQLQRNWIDMQKYVKEHTDKNALLMVPHDMEMGGFRIFSERKIICSYRDCGIIGFDYKAAKEWERRLSDIEAFQVFLRKPINTAILQAILKYKVDYIVFMNYYEPKDNNVLDRIYANETFALYKVKR